MKKLLLFVFGIAVAPVIVGLVVTVAEYFRPYRRMRT
jgi:hypothetical protein